MARFSGVVGYSKTVEDPSKPGKWTEQIVEKHHYGDVVKDFNRYQPSENLNPDINVSNIISIVADAFATVNMQNMRYVEFQGCKWEVISANVVRPRIRLNIGGVYNGPVYEAP